MGRGKEEKERRRRGGTDRLGEGRRETWGGTDTLGRKEAILTLTLKA